MAETETREQMAARLEHFAMFEEESSKDEAALRAGAAALLAQDAVSDSAAVEDMYRSEFGAALFNLYTIHGPRGDQLFSQRARTVRRMIAAMLEAD